MLTSYGRFNLRQTFTFVALLLVCALLVFPSLAQAAPCECKDAKDMLYRIKEAKALIAEYRNQITGMEAKEATTGKPLMFTQSLYDSTLQPRQQAVADQIFAAEPNPKPKIATGSTHPMACSVAISGGSECLREAVRRHEAHHAAICLPKKRWLVPAVVTRWDYREDMRLVDVALEEIAGYNVEIAYLTKELKALTPQCKQSWFLRFKVIVSGKGEIQQDGDSYSWALRNVYSGEMELSGGKLTDSSIRKPKMSPQFTPPTAQQIMNMTFEQRQEFAKEATKRGDEMKNSYVHRWSKKKNQSYDIDINSTETTTTRFQKRERHGHVFENTTTTKTVKGTAKDKETSGTTTFELDPRTNTYNILISIHPTGREQTIARVTQQEINRSKAGHGNLPTHETRPPEKTMVAAGSIGIPNVASILIGGTIHHYEKDLVFAPKEDILTFSSGKLKIDAAPPNLSKVSKAMWESTTVEVEYTLSKVPEKVTPLARK